MSVDGKAEIMKQWKAICLSAAAGLILFFPIDLLTGWDRWFPFVHPFNLLSVAVWAVILYLALRGRMTERACLTCAVLTLLTALPQGLFCLLVYSAWICVGVSVLVATALLIRLYQLKKRKNL